CRRPPASSNPKTVVRSRQQTEQGGHGKETPMTTPTRTLSMAIATASAIAAVAIPVTPAAAEPKNDVPFITATSTGPAAGEAKNLMPFAAAADARGFTSAAQPTPRERIIAQEQARHGDPRVFGPPQPAPT